MNQPEELIESEQIQILAKLLLEKEKQKHRDKVYASSKLVLSVLGAGIVIAGAFIAPRAANVLLKSFLRADKDWDDWKKFNQGYLRQTLRRLERQKIVEIKQINDIERIVLTEKGKKKIIAYSIDELEITRPKRWDKKWRILIYDIPVRKRKLQNSMRSVLKRLGFFQMQESVYLIPYPCYEEVEFLRRHYFLGEYIKYLLVDKIEDDVAYKTYFDLK